MPRFHFNIRQNEILFEDMRGAELPDLRAAWAWAIEDARTLLRQDMVTAPMERLWVESLTRAERLSHQCRLGELSFTRKKPARKGTAGYLRLLRAA
jgi:hypothetical protein